MKDFVKNIALMAASIAVALLVIEGYFALFNPQRVVVTSAPHIFFEQYDPEMGWVNKEGAAGIYRPNPAIPATDVRINNLGYRGNPVSLVKPPNVKRILILGDSNTFGYGVAEKERFSDILARSLPKRYQVLNLGVFGYGTDQEALLLERKGLRFNPDIVVLAFSAGDLSDNMSSINGGAGKPFCRFEGDRLTLHNVPVPRSSPFMTTASTGSLLKTFLYRHSHLYRFVIGRLIASNYYMPDSVLEMDRDEGMRTTVGIITGMETVCRESGCELVVLLLSHGAWIDALSRNPAAKVGYYSALQADLEQLGIPVIDTTLSFVERARRGEELFFKNDPVHLTAQGNTVVAEVLGEGLARLESSPRR